MSEPWELDDAQVWGELDGLALQGELEESAFLERVEVFRRTYGRPPTAAQLDFIRRWPEIQRQAMAGFRAAFAHSILIQQQIAAQLGPVIQQYAENLRAQSEQLGRAALDMRGVADRFHDFRRQHRAEQRALARRLNPQPRTLHLALAANPHAPHRQVRRDQTSRRHDRRRRR